MSENETKTEAAETETGAEHEFNVSKWRVGMLLATSGICRELDDNKIDEQDYGRIFKAVRLIMDPEYDDRPPIVRALESMSRGLVQNPQLLLEILKRFGVIEDFKVQPPGPSAEPVEPATSGDEGAIAYLFLTVTPDGETTGVTVASEEHPTTTGETLYLRFLAVGAPTYEEARRLALQTYELAYPALAKKFPVTVT